MKKVIITLLVAALVVGGALFYMKIDKNGDAASDESSQPEPAGFDKSLYSIDEPGSPWWVVNKQRPLPADYSPAELTSPDIKLRWADDAESMQVSALIAEPLERLYADAKLAGHELMLVSGYRSEDYQRQLYEGYVASSGQEAADKFSARPGTSEHQTGLVVDLGRTDGECEIEACFGDTKAGKWLAAQAHKYGFIIRYLEDKEVSTGYIYEPWHLRYVGPELAAELYRTKQTMEEFFAL